MIRRGLVFSLAAFVATLAIWFWMSAHIDPAATVPMHWGPNGPDRYGTGAEAVRFFLLFPAIVAGVALLFAVLPYFEPFRSNLWASKRVFLISWIGTNILFVFVAFAIAWVMTRSDGVANDWWRGIVAASFLLIVVLGDSMPKTRRNFLLGVRTRWTLTSDLAWEKTHRLAGRLFILTGLWGIFAAFYFKPTSLHWAILPPLLLLVLVCYPYSYLVWRDDPNKTVGDIEHA